MTQKAGTHLVFKDAWTFPEEVEKRIATFVNAHPGLWLHAPVGISKIGKGGFDEKIKMLTLDIDPTVKPDIICNIFKMTHDPKIKSIIKYAGGFDGVISDPVWYTRDKNKTVGLAYPQRRFLSYQVRDVLKPGGWWIFNGLWNPKVKGLDIKKTEVPMQAYSSFRNVSLLVYCQKPNERIEAFSNGE